MTKVTELTIRVRAAVKYPGWRVDFAGPDTVVLTHVMGKERIIEIRRRRKLWSSLVKAVKWAVKWLRRIYWQVIDAVAWIVPAVIWLLGMWLVCMGIIASALFM